MSKVLLSFLGTGSPKNRELSNQPITDHEREYREATYRLYDSDENTFKFYDETFLASAIADHHRIKKNIDKYIFIGTPKSMWEELYRTFYNKGRAEEEHVINNPTIFEKYANIANRVSGLNHHSKLNLTSDITDSDENKDEIENVLGNGSKIVLIKYGISEEEIRDNMTKILSIENFLKNGDELIVDVTHSFRSLPIFAMNLLIYLRNVSSKKIKISHIYYGMLEVSGELKTEEIPRGYAPVVDLKSILEVQDWITGAYAFKEFGNTYQITSLLQNLDSTSYAEDRSMILPLENFSDNVNLNYLNSMKTIVQQLNGIREKANYKLANLILNPVVSEFTGRLNINHFNEFEFLKNLAEWQYKKKKYVQAYLTVEEAIISYVAQQSGFQYNDDGDPLYLRGSLSFGVYEFRQFIHEVIKDVYKQIRSHINRRIRRTIENNYSTNIRLEQIREEWYYQFIRGVEGSDTTVNNLRFSLDLIYENMHTAISHTLNNLSGQTDHLGNRNFSKEIKLSPEETISITVNLNINALIDIAPYYDLHNVNRNRMAHYNPSKINGFVKADKLIKSLKATLEKLNSIQR